MKRVDDAGAPDGLPENAIPGPMPSHLRFEEFDVIRGVALLGVLVMNLVHGFRAPLSYVSGVAPKEHLSPIDNVVDKILYAFVEDKAMTLFSILFGMGLAMIFLRAESDRAGIRVLARRLAILFFLGLLHSVFIWQGDILMPYAVAGLISLLVIRRSCWVLLALGLLLPAVYPLIVWKWPWLMPKGGPAAIAHYEQALSIYGHASYAQVVAFRAPDIVGIRAHFLLVRGLAQILANVILGIFIWRMRVFVRHEELFWVALGGLVVGGGYATYRVFLEPGQTANFLRLGWNMTLAPFAAGYGSALLLLLSFAGPRALLVHLAPAGRMALTNYITQSAVFTTLFYGYGGGLLGQVGIVEAVKMGIVVYALQVVLSAAWLRRFRFGPAEWLVRSLTYGKLQPMAIQPVGRSPT